MNNRVGQFFDIGDSSQGLTVETDISGIDTDKMCASVQITTPAADREGDSLNAKGIQLTNYRHNPIVLWNHGFQDPMPVGMSEDPDQKLTISTTRPTGSQGCLQVFS
jgi:hypothetical protein